MADKTRQADANTLSTAKQFHGACYTQVRFKFETETGWEVMFVCLSINQGFSSVLVRGVDGSPLQDKYEPCSSSSAASKANKTSRCSRCFIFIQNDLYHKGDFQWQPPCLKDFMLLDGTIIGKIISPDKAIRRLLHHFKCK